MGDNGDGIYDEDFELFLSEFVGLCNKYHYVVAHNIQISKMRNSGDYILEMIGDGEFVWPIVSVSNIPYSCKTKIRIEGDSND